MTDNPQFNTAVSERLRSALQWFMQAEEQLARVQNELAEALSANDRERVQEAETELRSVIRSRAAARQAMEAVLEEEGTGCLSRRAGGC